jgi:HlyD family secretion protein
MTTAASSRRTRRFSPWWGLLLIPVIGVGLVMGGVIKPPARPGAATAKLETVEVLQSTFRVGVSGSGTLNAVTTLDVKPKISGTITKLPSEGQRVTKGELIARLDDSSFLRNVENAQFALAKTKAQLESTRSGQVNNRANQQQTISSARTQFLNAQTEVASAQTNLLNARNLFNVGGGTAQSVTDAERALSKANANLESARVAYQTAQNAVNIKADSDGQDLRNLQLAVDQASISLKNAQVDLGNTKIYAPFNGIVSSVPGQVGAPASSAAQMLTLINDARVEFPVQVDESEISKVKLGQKAEVTLDALAGQTFSGKVTRISPKATVVSNIAVFYVTVTLENKDRALRPGMTAEAEIISREYPNALQLPKRAIQTVSERTYVKVLASDGKTEELLRVKTGPDDGANIVISQGLQPGQTVLLPPRPVKAPASNGPLP